MRNKLIFIAGYCATGKTAFSLELARELLIPCYNKDFIKEAIGVSFDYENTIINRKLSQASFSMLKQIAEVSMRAGTPAILESNFKKEEAETLKPLLNQYNCETLTYLFLGDLRAVHKRFIERENSPERHSIHKSHMFDDFYVFEAGIGPLKDFEIGGEVIVVDTTSFNAVDYEYLIKQGRRFLT